MARLSMMVTFVALAGACSSPQGDDCDPCGSTGADEAGESSADTLDPAIRPPMREPIGSGPGACSDLGELCTVADGCCGGSGPALVCVASSDGVGACHESCTDDAQCDTGCCVRLHDGTGACMDASMCAHECAPLFGACDRGTDCCGGAACSEQGCRARCESDGDCPTGCCGPDGSCEPSDRCGADATCKDGEYACTTSGVLYACDDDAWYAVDCEAACEERGYAGAAACGNEPPYEGGACRCRDA